MPLFTEIEKNNCFRIYSRSDLNNNYRKKHPKSIELASEFMRGKRASGTKHARKCLQKLQTWQI